MSDIAIPGVNSKYGTEKIIDGLMSVEKNKLVQLQAQKKDYENTKALWQDENRRMQAVRDAARSLYSFDNPFGSKTGSSSDENSLTVQASRVAEPGTYTVKVNTPATNDRLLSASVAADTTLPEGDYAFHVGDKAVNLHFAGGKVKNFVDALNQKAPDTLKASLIRDTADTEILQLEAVPVGAKNGLQIEGAAVAALTKLGMIGPPSSPGQVLVSAPTEIKPGEQASWTVQNPAPVTSTTVLRLTGHFAANTAPTEPPPTGFKYPEGGMATYQGITLSGAPMEGSVPPPPVPEVPPEVRTLKGLSAQTSAGSMALADLPDTETDQTVDIPLPSGAVVSSIAYQNQNTSRTLNVSKAEIVDTAQKQGWVPLHPLSQAQDAELMFEGVKITRPSNAVSDVIAGATLTLKAPSTNDVTVTIGPDRKAIKDGVINFLARYNRLMTDIVVLTSMRPDDPAQAPVILEAGYLSDAEKKQAEDRMGKLQGDIGLNQMRNAMERIMMSPYKTDGSEFSLLAQVGISTNSTGSSVSGGQVDASKLRGYMEMDEAKFDAAVTKDINGVKKLFGNSLGGTLVVDSGAAWAIDQLLRPSTELGGLNSLKESTLDGQIKDKTREISDYNDYLARYHQDLKEKYGQMEASLNAMNKNAQSLDQLGNGK